ncbi:MAG TPA: SOS response-associated peptidase family protein [Methyloceanibacter sp.]|nr:SOS response-associated peptidase family protein [Methyloceanibacter sp.]
MNVGLELASGPCYRTDMCNLYTTKASPAEIAAHFRAQLLLSFNAGEGEVYPGGQGMVVREEAGERIVQSMAWGFPLAQKSKKTGLPIKPKPVNNIRDLSSFMWRFVAPRRENRCLIPLTGFCEAEGEKGAMTRTWFGVHERTIFAWAGMWKVSDEWGPAYSGLMTECNEIVRPVHDRMPVLLHEEDYDRWLHGSLEDVIEFQERCFPDELTAIERTADPWFRRKSTELSSF